MRQTAEHRSYARSGGDSSPYAPATSFCVPRLHRGFTARGRSHNPRGFTLIELVIAMAILLVVMVGILSSISFAYTTSTDTEMRNTAKNIAGYTLEYLRARMITRGTPIARLTALGITSTSTGTYGWYVPGTGAGTNANGAFPSMIDLGDLPLQSDGFPCNLTQARVRSSYHDGQSNPTDSDSSAIVRRSQVFRFASKHAALPTESYGTSSSSALAWTSTLQGYVSVKDRVDPTTTQNPAPEDKNLAQMHFSASYTASGIYRTLLASNWTGLVVRFPGVYPSTAPVISSFTPLTGYLAKVYTTDLAKVTSSNQAYNPYYTNVLGDKAATQAYRGFRVLTQIVARSALPVDGNGFRQVQYYDVSITVLWMNGTHESSYELVSQIIAY